MECKMKSNQLSFLIAKIVLSYSSCFLSSAKQQPMNGTCNIPRDSGITAVVLTDREDNWLDISLLSSRAPELSKIDIFCHSNYTLANGEKIQRSVCQRKGRWHPTLRPCQKSCPTLHADNVDITCYRNGSKVDCNGKMVNGTGVRPVCKPLYHSETKIYSGLTCLETGKWDGNMPKCVPDCGIPNIRPDTLVYRGLPTNASDYPWHVAIYKLSAISRRRNVLICGGTLISANMVLSAAHCFYNEGRGKVLNSSSDYEVVVGKYTRDYEKIDNGFQRAHKIRDIIFTKQGFNPALTYQRSNDIVVLLLKTPVEISKYVLPACVDWSANDFLPVEGEHGKFVGWGANQIENVGSQELLYAELPFISYVQCIGKVKELDSDKFCAGSETGPGGRKGDGGGGLIFHDASSKTKYYVRGILSTRDAYSENSYATFTDISKHIDWLKEVRVKVETEISENQKISVGVCDVQYGLDRRIEVFDKNDKWLSISSGSRAPEFSTIEITCRPTYILPNGHTFQRSSCFQEENWTPPIEPCLKVCKDLGPLENIDLSCYREGYEVNCNKTFLIVGTVVQPRCKNLHRMQEETTYRELKCQENGEWDSDLFKCVSIKSCPTLRKDNFTDITCHRNGLRVNCNSEMVNGTIVKPVCKPLYHSETEIHSKLTCLETGKWDGNMPKCIPDCGIPNIPLETLIYKGTSTNSSSSPWHVAIYQLSAVSREKNLLICGGTLISANMVLSAAHCFFNEGWNMVLNCSSDYEVVVGKYTRNYTKIDNGFQRAHKIRDIIFTEQGYSPILTDQHSNDIVVLVLKTPVEISRYVLPACVNWSANNFQPADGTSGKLVGWGENQFKGVGSEELLYAELPFVSYQQCVGKVNELDPDKFCAGSETAYTNWNPRKRAHMTYLMSGVFWRQRCHPRTIFYFCYFYLMCAFSEDLVQCVQLLHIYRYLTRREWAGARKGDSGGGLMFSDASTKVKYYVCGIVSSRNRDSNNSYVTFTDISKYIDWLKKIRIKVMTEISGNQKTSPGICNVQLGATYYSLDKKIEVS